ncbi:MAG: hypothetical protein ABDH32_01395 [Candidatus Caldarchaeales archaeon]
MKIAIDPYIPEQILDYFEPISGLKAAVHEKYLIYFNSETMVIVGYPIKGEYREEDLIKIINEYREKYVLGRIVVIAPSLPSSLRFEDVKVDEYYRLSLPIKPLSKRLRYMVSRAERDVTVDVSGDLKRDHIDLIRDFLKRENVEEYMRYICNRLDRYISRSKNVRIIDAYDRNGRLVGFDILDLSSTKYSFYMFNFISRESRYIPGVSDLLLYNLLKISQEYGKVYVNMGLGIDEGVRRFKLKWGAESFLPYNYAVLKSETFSELSGLFSKL